MLEVRDLTKRYFGLTAVDGLSFEAEAGAVVGLIGPNGSGKSTSIDCISGFQRADAGRWFLEGQELTGLAPHRIAQAGLTRTFQTVRAYDELTLLENLCVAVQENDGVGWLEALRRGPALRQADAAARARPRPAFHGRPRGLRRRAGGDPVLRAAQAPRHRRQHDGAAEGGRPRRARGRRQPDDDPAHRGR